MTRRFTAIIVLVTLAMGVAGCTASRAARRGDDAARLGDWDAAVAHYTRAVQDEPDRADYKIELERVVRDRIEAARPKPAIEKMREQALNLE